MLVSAGVFSSGNWAVENNGGRWQVFTGSNRWNTGINVDVNQWQYLAVVFTPGRGIQLLRTWAEADSIVRLYGDGIPPARAIAHSSVEFAVMRMGLRGGDFAFTATLDGQEVASTWQTSPASWTMLLTEDGSYTLTATAQDEAGNVSAPSDPLQLVIDTVPPLPPSFQLANDSDTPPVGDDLTEINVVALVGASDPLFSWDRTTPRSGMFLSWDDWFVRRFTNRNA